MEGMHGIEMIIIEFIVYDIFMNVLNHPGSWNIWVKL